MNEQWAVVEGYRDLYEVSNLGRVRSVIRWVRVRHPTKPYLVRLKGVVIPASRRAGYLALNLCRNGNMRLCYVHRLVARAFVPNPDNKPDINHKDGNKHNNASTNLEWVTSRENVVHAMRSNVKIAKLTKEDVLDIRRRIAGGEVQRRIAEEYGVSPNTICRINTRKSWWCLDPKAE